MNNSFSSPLEIPCRRAWTDDEKMKLLRLKMNGCSFYSLADRYNVPPYEIREIIEEVLQQLAFNRSVKNSFKRQRYSFRMALGRALECLFLS